MIKICINGGHCPGLDPGAVGSRVTEAEVTRDLMASVARYLRAVGYAVLEVQSNRLEEVAAACNGYGADLMVSIHCNAAANADARGAETYCYRRGGAGESLAFCVQDQLVDALGVIDRGVKYADYYVLRETICPAVLVETAFVSNEEDEALLLAQGDEFARAIARGVTDFYA